jgi:RimJ/RimL family protein N-acetyltransferase
VTSAFVSPVVLARGGVTLVPLGPEHAAGLGEAAADGALWTLRVTSVPAPGQERAYVEAALAAPDRFAFAVLDDAGVVLGSTSFHDILPEPRRVEIGYTWYAERAQRTHVNTTCKLLLLEHAFGPLACATVGWRTDSLNLVSQAAIERLGARRDGVVRGNATRRDGTVRDTVMYSVTAAEWPAIRARLEARIA